MDFLLKKTLILQIIVLNSLFGMIIHEIKVFFNKKSFEIYQLPGMEEEMTNFHFNFYSFLLQHEQMTDSSKRWTGTHDVQKQMMTGMDNNEMDNDNEVTQSPTMVNSDKGAAHHLLSWTQCPLVCSPSLTAHAASPCGRTSVQKRGQNTCWLPRRRKVKEDKEQ